MGVAGEENGRAILGTVPVEEDGSARFTVPALKPLLFQALDKNGMAYQTMRSVAYVQPGEQISCVGCHESRAMAPPQTAPMAALREPSSIDPGTLGGRPFSFVEVVQPVLNRHCVACHGGDKMEGEIDLTDAVENTWTKSYFSLTTDATLVPRFPQRNQIQVTPSGGQFGALGSGLIRLVREGHQGVILNDDDVRRLAAWIDCNAIFYGTPDPANQARQLRGEPVEMPDIQ
jgi:cytochrome c553